MTINCDPDGKPELTQEMLDAARNRKHHIVTVICDEKGANVGDGH
jgi:hypothetical protein